MTGTAIEVVTGQVLDTDAARVAESQVKEAKREGENALWKLAEALWTFDQLNGWAALGYESLNKWLEDPAIDMTRGTYYRGVGTWQTWAIDKQVEPKQLEAVSMSKAALVADEVASGRHRAATILRDVQSMPASALREKYGKPKRGRPSGKADSAPRQSAPSQALKALRELHWDWLEAGIAQRGRGSRELRQARMTEAVRELLEWRDAYLS